MTFKDIIPYIKDKVLVRRKLWNNNKYKVEKRCINILYV